jgi:hypothetical protein
MQTVPHPCLRRTLVPLKQQVFKQLLTLRTGFVKPFTTRRRARLRRRRIRGCVLFVLPALVAVALVAEPWPSPETQAVPVAVAVPDNLLSLTSLA